MSIEFNCQHCGKVYSVDDQYSGSQASCECGSIFIVPSKESGQLNSPPLLNQAAPNRPAPNRPAPNRPAPNRPAPRPSPNRNIPSHDFHSESTQQGTRPNRGFGKLVGPLALVVFLVATLLGLGALGIMIINRNNSPKQGVPSQPSVPIATISDAKPEVITEQSSDPPSEQTADPSTTTSTEQLNDPELVHSKESSSLETTNQRSTEVVGNSSEVDTKRSSTAPSFGSFPAFDPTAQNNTPVEDDYSYHPEDTFVPPIPTSGDYELQDGVRFKSVTWKEGDLTCRCEMWIYLPENASTNNKVPCVLIAPAGSTMMAGKALSTGGRDEHLPYVKAGLAVIAYEVYGHFHERSTNDQVVRAFLNFRSAYVGLVNARNALEYALTVPEIDPDNLYCAGHSSAGALALLFAAHEPRLKGCVAYAPCCDVKRHLNQTINNPQIQRIYGNLERFTIRSSPMTHAEKVHCPVFLFHTVVDRTVPFSDSTRFAELLQKHRKSVELSSNGKGDHYTSMIQYGIPQGITWLKKQISIQRTKAEVKEPVLETPPSSTPMPKAQKENPVKVEPPKPEDPELIAQSKLKLAKQFLKLKPEVAKRRLTEVIEMWPDSTAAEEAKAILETLSDKITE